MPRVQVQGIPSEGLPNGGETPQHPETSDQGRLDREGEAASTSPRDSRRADPLGPANGPQAAEARRREVEPQAGAHLWRDEGRWRPTPRKQKRSRPADGSMRRHQAINPHQIRAIDFLLDATADGRRIRFIKVIDEHSRLCLAIWVGRRCKAKDVLAVQEDLTSLYPAPAVIRSDNEPEFNAHSLRRMAERSETLRRTSTRTLRGKTALTNRSTTGAGTNDEQ